MPQRPFLKKWAQPILVPAVVLIATVVILALVARQVQSLQDVVRHATDVKERLNLVYSLLQEGETAVGSFILTGDDFHLTALNNARRRLSPELDALTDLVAGNPVQAEALTGLRAEVESQLERFSRSVELARAGDIAAVRDEMRARGQTDPMLNIRSALDVMVAEEDRILVSRRAETSRSSGALQLLAFGTLFLVMTVAVISLAQAVRRREHLEAVETELRATNQRLAAEIAERESVEQQLHQVQKMEAIGQLTGGIAHDFNNMLAVVIGALNIMQRRIDRGDFNVAPFMQAAIEGAQRGGALTQRLLAFARKQVLEPRPLDPNRLVSGMSDLLRRTLGETIQMEVDLAGGLWLIYADAHQLETSILNLVVNARDAMPEGGKLTIGTSNIPIDAARDAQHEDAAVGEYVAICVRDTGMGMSPDVVARAFDPFFTTKGPGRGTGLGLSQVYGFVKQSGGHINIASAPGQGSTITIYLPRYVGNGEEESAARPVEPAALPRARPGESVLVVEDEDAVRKLAVEGLSELGYAVLQAANAADALKLIDEHPEISLLFTDVVMPNVNGRQLSDEALRRRPDLKVLYTTGYTRDAVVHNGTLDPGVRLLGKPYTLEQLSRMLRDILDR